MVAIQFTLHVSQVHVGSMLTVVKLATVLATLQTVSVITTVTLAATVAGMWLHYAPSVSYTKFPPTAKRLT